MERAVVTCSPLLPHARSSVGSMHELAFHPIMRPSKSIGRSQVLWKAVEKVLGPTFKRDQCEVALVGTPLTHARYLRRDRGTYGPAIMAGMGTFPGPQSPLPNLLCCGDSTFPGIGVPAVAASGMVAANTLVGVWDHWKMLDAMGL